MNPEFDKLVKEYTSQDRCETIVHAVRQAGKVLADATIFENAEKTLTDWLVEKLYISDAEGIDALQVMVKTFDFNRRLGISLEAHVTKYGEPDIGRLLLFVAREIRKTKSAEAHWKNELDSVKARLRNWHIGESRPFLCPVCDGVGSTDKHTDGDVLVIQCANCDGKGKLLLERKVIT